MTLLLVSLLSGPLLIPANFTYYETAFKNALETGIAMPFLQDAKAQSSVSLSVRTQYSNGQSLSGMWTVLRGQNGAVLATGFSPITFNLAAGQQYTVTVSNYQQTTFERWADGVTTASHSVKITQNTSLVALYKTVAKFNQRAVSETLRVTDTTQSSLFRAPIPVQHIRVVLPNTLSLQDDTRLSTARASQILSSSVQDGVSFADALAASLVLSPKSTSSENADTLSVEDALDLTVTRGTPPTAQSFDASSVDNISVLDSVTMSLLPAPAPPANSIQSEEESLHITESVAATIMPMTPIIHMSDTTASYGVLVSATPQQISAEWVKPGSQLIGDNINSITLRLQRIGSPTGNIEVGVFDADANLKVSFGSVSIATMPSVMTDTEFVIPDLYTIVLDDRIGIRFTGGSSTEGVSVMMDKVTTDSMFDGTRSQRVRFGTTSWITYDTNEDLYMILKQTRPGTGVPPPSTLEPLDVYAVDQTGVQVSGVYTVIHRNGVVMAAENTPLTYFATVGATYTVTPSAYEIFQSGSYTFDHWQDTGSTSRQRTVVTSGAMNVTAVYKHNQLGVVSIPVRSADLGGNAISGLYFNISPSIRSNIMPGYSPLAWTLEADTTYTITPQDYGNYIFDHWQDGNKTRARAVNPFSGMNLTAFFAIKPPNPADMQPPTINIKSPLSGRIFSTSAATISGISSDNEGIMRVEVSIDGAQFQKTDGLVNWSVLTPSLTNGTHTAVVRSVDAAGNTANATTTFTIAANPILTKTGVYIPLYIHPSGSNLEYYRTIANAKVAHPSVPIVAAINPAGGPGSGVDPYFTSAIGELRGAGVVVIGYTPTKYGARDINEIKADITKYVSWYSIDGIMLDEFPNVVGYESKYANITAYAKSLGLKIVIGNAGTDVPQSYVGKVDVIGITEGDGYMPMPWLQYCILCTTDGWHYNYDKNNFRFSRYAVDYPDNESIENASKWVGLLYLTNGVSPTRWTTLPPYFDSLVAALDS